MRLPRFRFTLQRMLVATAIIGIVLATSREMLPYLFTRRDDYSGVARMFARVQEQDEAFIRDVALVLKTMKDTPQDREYRSLLESRVRSVHRRAPYLEAMRVKYERAARFPWLDVAPDPPEPE